MNKGEGQKWYSYVARDESISTEYFFNMINGGVKEMLRIRNRFVMRMISDGRNEARKMVMPDITGHEANDSLEGCFRMYHMNQYAVAAEVLQSDDVTVIEELTPSMVKFRDAAAKYP